MSKLLDQQADVAIVGAGLAGMTLALVLAQAGVRVALIERQTPKSLMAPEVDGRTTAIAAAARRVLEGLGIWSGIEAEAGPIWDIRVSDRQSPLHVHFDHAAVDDTAMGHIVENHDLRRVLVAALAAQSGIDAFWGQSVSAFEPSDTAATLTMSGGQSVTASLVAAADGRGSALRRMAGIGVRSVDYGETAIVCTAYHRHPHDGIAHERFYAGGPFAILPMADNAQGRHRASIVWTERRALAEHLAGLPKGAFQRQLARRFGEFLGEIEVPGEVWTYPLSLTLAKRLTGKRLALVGEAAHGMHPIAGQGFNVSMRDITGLRDSVAAAVQAGQDPGGPAVLSAYARRRWPDILAMAAATDGLNRLFRTDLPPVALARQIGLAAVNRLPPLKRQFQRYAMGLLPQGRPGG